MGGGPRMERRRLDAREYGRSQGSAMLEEAANE